MVNSAKPYFDFDWPVAPDYSWVEWLGPDGEPVRARGWDAHPNTAKTFSVEKGKEKGPILTPAEGPHRSFRPMDRVNAALFREFGNLELEDADAILGFVRRYGWLGVVPRASQVVRLSDGKIHHAEGEPLMLWVNEIAQMRRAIWLWEHPDAAKRERDYLTWLFDSHLQKVQGRMSFDGTGAELRIRPMTLLAAMWLQLALAITGAKTFIGCKLCGKQIEISTAESGFRTNREFCSASCKTTDYRKRKREALRLAGQRKTAAAIAKEIGTEKTTVRRWIAESKSANRKSTQGKR